MLSNPPLVLRKRPGGIRKNINDDDDDDVDAVFMHQMFMHMHFHAPPRHPSSRLSFKAFPTSGFLERGTPGRKSLSESLNAGSALASCLSEYGSEQEGMGGKKASLTSPRVGGSKVVGEWVSPPITNPRDA